VGTSTVPTPAVTEPAPTRRGARFLPTVGSVVVVGVLGVGQLTGWFGADAAAPEVGDCVHRTDDASFEVVDCGADAAEYTVVGIEAQQMTYDDAVTSVDTCAAFATAEFVLWSGESETEPGDVYCAAPA
jgi:hypothetical protein